LVTKDRFLRGNLLYMSGHGTTELGPQRARVDMHCHSAASQLSKLGVQRALGLPECATPPQEVYELAKRRGMDFVTITDHDTIDGVLEIAERPDVFVSEELTAHFRGEPQAVHVLCYGISGADHEWLQAHSDDVERCAAYLHEREIACALAHPYYTVAAPLGRRHLRRLAELFSAWEVRNGARAPELNRPAAVYVATRDGIGVGGSDDHAGTDIARTFTESPCASTPAEFLAHVRAGRVSAHGAQGSAAKWAHAAIALAVRSLSLEAPPSGHAGAGTPGGGASAGVDPARVLTMVKRLLREGDARHGARGSDLGPEDARCLLRAWLGALELDELGGSSLLELMQQQDFSHAALYRRACRMHERRLRSAVEDVLGVASGSVDAAQAARGIFEACIAVVPYAPATAFLANEQVKLAALPGGGPRCEPERRREECENARVAVIADGIGSTHGVTRTIEQIRRREVPGFDIEVLGTDPEVDRRLSAVAEVEVPFYPGLRIGVPSLPAVVQTLADGNFDAVHVCTPGPAGIAGALIARALALPLLGSYHTELGAYAELRGGRQQLTQTVALAMSAFYGACDVVLSPSRAADEALAGLGVGGERVMRWDRGVDTQRFAPAVRAPERAARALNVLYAGRITSEKGVELLADAFLLANAREPRLHLLLAGGGPERDALGARLGDRASFLGWLEGDELAAAYARADIFVFPSSTDTFGQVVLEAQASGLPVLAVGRGGPLSLIEDRVSGLLCEPEAPAMAHALSELAASPLLRERLSGAALAAARTRTWESALERLADGYRSALAGAATGGDEARAAA
jgi:glycosyltransferase involved in cell wall biosynthesis/predicted metal-dependent phosphoesterase TrpH